MGAIHLAEHGRRLVAAAAVGLALCAGGLLTSAATIVARCDAGGGPCRLVVSNQGYWPLRLDPGALRVDGTAARFDGAGIVGPFGRATLTLYGQDRRPLRAAGTVHLVKGPLLGTNAGYDLQVQGGSR